MSWSLSQRSSSVSCHLLYAGGIVSQYTNMASSRNWVLTTLAKSPGRHGLSGKGRNKQHFGQLHVVVVVVTLSVVVVMVVFVL